MPKKSAIKTPSGREVSPELDGIGSRLKLARTKLDVGSVELDMLAGVGQGRVSRIESGARLANLTADALLKIARVLSVNLHWLLTSEGSMFTGTAEQAVSTVAAQRAKAIEALQGRTKKAAS